MGFLQHLPKDTFQYDAAHVASCEDSFSNKSLAFLIMICDQRGQRQKLASNSIAELLFGFIKVELL